MPVGGGGVRSAAASAAASRASPGRGTPLRRTSVSCPAGSFRFRESAAKGPKILPPPAARILEDTLAKKIVTSRGTKWLKTFAVLSKEYLCLSKPAGENSTAQWMASVGEVVTTDSLYEVFQRHQRDNADSHEMGTLTFDEARQALASLSICPTDEDFESLFSELDQDANGSLDWQVGARPCAALVTARIRWCFSQAPLRSTI